MRFQLLCFLISHSVFAQFGPEQLISTEVNGPVSIVVADMDGDTYPDVVTGARFTNEVAWFKNLDGLGNFSEVQHISSSDETRSVHVADLDMDGDLDVLAAGTAADQIFWQENLDGQGNFGPQQNIDTDADNVNDAIGADLDGDGLLDVLAAIDFQQSAVWYKNLGGGVFGARQEISFTVLSCRSIYAADLDNDGDLDVVANSGGSVTVSWFENLDGLGTFGPKRVVAGEALYVADVVCADIDGDADLDIMGVTNAEGKVAWHENLDGQGNFGPQRVVTNLAMSCTSIHLADLDNDGDMDVIFGNTPTSTEETSEVAWSENVDGLGNFGPKQVLTTAFQFTKQVYAADVDGDTDMDIFAVAQNNDKVAWFENLTILGIDEQSLVNKISIYPNPANSILHINAKRASLSSITISDSSGKLLSTIIEEVDQIDVSHYNSGVYLVTLESVSGYKSVKKFLKE